MSPFVAITAAYGATTHRERVNAGTHSGQNVGLEIDYVVRVKIIHSDECLSWCDIKEECYEMDRLYGDGSHTYLRGCWLPGSDDAMKQTGCVTVNAEVKYVIMKL